MPPVLLLGLDAVYLPFLIPKGHLGDFLKKRNVGRLSAGITIPHKESVVEFASSQGELVEEIGAQTPFLLLVKQRR